MSRINRLFRVLPLTVIFLVLLLFHALAADPSPDPVVVEAPEVQDSVESFLEAVQINGQPIDPTAFPEAGLGDVITFRVRIHNTHAGALEGLLCGADWDRGLVYQGNLTSNHVQCRYDEQSGRIEAEIQKIQGDPAGVTVIARRLSDSTCWYMFDLKMASCENLSVNVYTDELYSCQSEKTYFVAPRITTPEVRYSVKLSAQQFVAGQKQLVTVNCKNAGDGIASDFILETNLERFFATVGNLSPGFVYDGKTGTFIAGSAIKPGRSTTLKFELAANRNTKDPLPEEALLFRPVYADDCGLRLQAPETLAMLRPAGQKEPTAPVSGASLGLEVSLGLPDVVKECQETEMTVTVSKTKNRRFYDLEVVLDTANYAYLGGLAATGFDGRKPRVHTSRPGVVVFSFDNDPNRVEPLSQGGTLRFKARKKCSSPAGVNVSARFIDWLTAATLTKKAAAVEPQHAQKREVTDFAQPLLHQSADLVLRVTPECRRLESDMPIPWNLYVTNRGNASARDVTLEDVLQENLVPDNAGDQGTPQPEIEVDKPTPGKTTLRWRLGEVKPSTTRKVPFSARLRQDRDLSELLVDTTNDVRLVAGCDGETCRDQGKTAPCFILPDDCIGDVYEKPEKFHGFLGLAQIYKSNLYQTYKNPDGVWATYVTPGLWVALPASHERLVEIATTSATPGGLTVSPFFPKNDRRYQAYMLYSPQWEFYHNESENNMVTHRLDSYFHYNSRNKLSLQLIDQFKRAHDSTSSRTYTVEDKYKTNLFSAVSTLNLTEKFELRLDFSNYWLDYDDSENSVNDRTDNSWALYGYFHLTDKTWLFAEYEYADLDYKRAAKDCVETRIFGGVRWEITQKTSGHLKGGYGERDFDADDLSDTGTVMAEFVIDYDMTERTRIVANAYRRYEETMSTGLHWDNLFGEVATNMLTHMIGLSLTYDLTSKLHFNLHGTLFYDEYAYEYEDDLWEDKRQRDREYALSPSIKFDFLKWLTFDLAYTYTHLDSNYNDAEYEDHTVFLRGSIYR